MSRRLRLEICIEILSKIKDGESKPIRIRYGANISLRAFKQAISFLEDQGLVGVVYPEGKRSSVLYRITEKGEDVLLNLNSSRSLLELIDASSL